MFFDTREGRIGMVIVYAELVTSICLNGVALYILLRKRKRTVGDLMLIHLCCTEVILAAWRLTFSLMYIFTDAKVESKFHLTGEIILWTCFYLTMIYITLDRVFAVKLTYRYKIIVTKKKTFIPLLYCISYLGYVELENG